MQVGPKPEDNMKKAASMVKDAAKKGAQVICLPELYRSQYFCQKEDVELFKLAETIPGPSTELFTSLAKKLRVAIVVPLFEKRAAGIYHNSSVVIDKSGSIADVYRKMHIPDDPAYYEKFYFTPGDLGFRSAETGYGRVGTLICWDQWYPEGARLTSLTGPSVLFYPTAIGWHPYEKEQYGARQREAWMTVQRGHAVANGIYVASCNRTGFEKTVEAQAGIEFWGTSFICDPQGIIIAEAPSGEEAILTGKIDLALMEDIRLNWPFYRDRRIDAYGDITKRFID
ncbi:MAG: carbon-nitrogen hydrolase [Ignavibacteriaceae bacterium]|nr:carbon-nitrogen hydrolase [Ignavibacteriaceae bacterium]